MAAVAIVEPEPIVRAESVETRLDRLARRVLALERRLEALTRDEADRAIVTAIFAHTEGRVFSAAELDAHAALHPDLRAALGRGSVKQLGKKLHALANRRLGAFVLRRVTRDASGCIWSLHLHDGTGTADEADGH